jgi:hypothetical protein
MAWTAMTSMELSDEDKLDAIMPVPMPEKPDFPYGLRICLTNPELEKLDLDPLDCRAGHIIDLRAFARVTHVGVDRMEDGRECCRVELQIEELAVEEPPPAEAKK